MRIVLEFAPSDGKLSLPLHYNSEVQGLIYRNLDRALSRWLHDEGMPLGKRRFKFFTFSRLLGRYRINGDTIEFSGPVRVHIGSVHEEILESLALHLLREPQVRLGKEPCEVAGIEVEPLPRISRPMLVRTLSPITVYRTLYTAEGKRKTYYFNPSEEEWEELILANLRRKARALGWEKPRLEGLTGAHIRPVRVGKRDERIMRYRETVIKGWTGIYELDLPEPFFLLAYDAGLGAKNPQGFGMVELFGSD
ncbi:TPA: CRISPR-associated endoribonuclease Cas6 [Candidatus Bipolaricaulota bacterium]|nr:CRISPR-associated endoribonuclease Cas6 [Candidatus Bipolaricaulota bacterium]